MKTEQQEVTMFNISELFVAHLTLISQIMITRFRKKEIYNENY